MISTPFATLANEYGVSVSKISTIFKEYAEEIYSDYKVVAPRVLGIDEKHVTHHARGVFVDVENGKLLEIAINNKQETMEKTIKSFECYDTNIKVVTMDMSGGYNTIVQRLLPNAVVVIDKYHVIQALERSVNIAKKAIIARLKDEISQIQDKDEREFKENILASKCHRVHLFVWWIHVKIFPY